MTWSDVQREKQRTLALLQAEVVGNLASWILTKASSWARQSCSANTNAGSGG